MLLDTWGSISWVIREVKVTAEIKYEYEYSAEFKNPVIISFLVSQSMKHFWSFTLKQRYVVKLPNGHDFIS